MSFGRALVLFGILAIGSIGCGDDTTSTGGGDEGGGATGGQPAQGGSGGSDGSGGSGPVEPACTEPTAVRCEDQVILGMNLQSEPAPGGIETTAEGDGFVSVIDATAGGAFATTPDSYTYGRFTDTGLEKVSISDEDSLTSMDWDIAFRRYVGRINSGNSGPSCVAAARVPGAPMYDELTSVPDDLTFRKDEYFTENCELIPDGTGLEGSPATALSSYWTYPGCVQMTGNVYVVQLASGRHVKLTVTNFYNDESQEQCQTQGTVPMQDTGSANIRIRWAFLP
ncbi:MAG: hypothetical protein HOW73_08465 [Polyangiaceae bacterium]|nr:hypothetical protein [Polyangiaceae bacterium]